MYKHLYKSAISRIRSEEGFQDKLESSLMKHSNQRHHGKFLGLAPVFIICSLIIYVSITQTPALEGLLGLRNMNKIEEFKIINETTSEETSYSYISVVYLDGYAYSPSVWLKYSWGNLQNDEFTSIKGEKLGEVTLDLKGIQYTGTPPDFSSTHNVGTQIYKIKNVKKESAILVDLNSFALIFYRESKSVSSNVPLNLTMSDVFEMLSDNPEITSVELRNEENGAWMQTSEDHNLISLLNNELPSLSLLNYHELDKNPYDVAYDPGYRIPINVLFSDGRALNLQVFPSYHMVSTFGGFIKISEDLSKEVQNLFEQGSLYPSISDLIPYEEREISYLYLMNRTNGDEVLCEEPAWSSGALLSILSYYRVEEALALDSRMIITARIGKSEENNITINFYETDDKQILTEIGGTYYKPIRGQLYFEVLNNYLYNNTGIR